MHTINGITYGNIDDAKAAAFRVPKHFRVPMLVGPDGQRWKWVASRRYWAAVTIGKSEQMFTKSKTMCFNQNQRRKSFGYTDVYSMRDRGWPT